MDEPHPGPGPVLERLARYARFFRVMLGPKGDPSFSLTVQHLVSRNMDALTSR